MKLEMRGGCSPKPVCNWPADVGAGPQLVADSLHDTVWSQLDGLKRAELHHDGIE